MKKAFGILFLIIGLAMIGLGIVALTDAASRNSTFDGRIQNEFSYEYRANNNAQQAVGFGLLIGGLFFFIIGIVMVAPKSSSQRKKEAELEAMKRVQSINNSEQTTKTQQQNINVDQLTKQAINLYNQKDYYAAISVIQRTIRIHPSNHVLHFNLACLYSLTNNPESFSSLSTAIENGYMNFDTIKSSQDLVWLRSHSDYDEFVKNGYKIKAKPSQKPVEDALGRDDIYTQLEKLGKLKEKGLLTEEEFQEQKKKILI